MHNCLLLEIPLVNHTLFLLPGAGGPRTVTIEELKKRTKVTDSQLDTEIEETDMIDLASHFDNIETYPVQLGLDPSERRDVTITASNYNIRTAMDKALRLWRQHNPRAATYRALVMIVLRMEKEEVARAVCQTVRAIPYILPDKKQGDLSIPSTEPPQPDANNPEPLHITHMHPQTPSC